MNDLLWVLIATLWFKIVLDQVKHNETIRRLNQICDGEK